MGNKVSTTESSKLSTLTALTKDNKRWIVFGIALNHVLVPSIRPILEQEILKEYNDLKSSHSIHVQTSHCFPVPKYPTCNGMKYENINANDIKLKPPRYKKFDYSTFDYKVTSHVDFGKLFLQNYMAKFNAFNETCDASAVLNLLGRIPVFSAALQTAANIVRECRNAWGHCVFTDWNEANFKKRFDEMRQLVKEVGLPLADESKVLTDLNDWEAKGIALCLKATIDAELAKVVQEHVSKLSNDVEKITFESQEEMNNLRAMLNNIQLLLQKCEKRFEKMEEKQDILQQEQSSTAVKIDQLSTIQEVLQQEQSSATVNIDKLKTNQELLQQQQCSNSVKIDQLNTHQKAVQQRVTELEGQKTCKIYYINQLTKCDFKPNIEKYNELFHPGTREWLSKKLDRWFECKASNSQVMILTADAGFGKSTFAAQVCKEYQERGQLAASHFFKTGYSDYSDPCKMLQSLASQLCENVSGFRENLAAQLQRNHSSTTIGDSFRVFLKDPLNSLPDQKFNILIVIDGLDESVSDEKKHLLDVIEEEFQMLPKWVKIFVTSRPELVTKEKLDWLNHVETLQNDKDNQKDLKSYLVSCINDRHDVNEIMLRMDAMVKSCEGSFLYAYYCQLELRKLNSVGDVLDVLPKGIHSIYQKYFKRMEEELKKVSTDIEFDRILEILVAMQDPFPLSLIAKILKFPGSTRTMKEVISRVNECLSTLLPVYDDCVTVFHKTVVDWLRADGKYGNHSFSISLGGANKVLWQACRQIFEQLEMNGPKEGEHGAEKYALKNGLNHLWNITNIGKPVVLPIIGNRIPADVIRLKRGKKFFGDGWIVFKDDVNVYVMTSNSVLRLIQCDQVDNDLEIVVFRVEDKPVNYNATVTKTDFVVVSSNEDGALDYAVLRLKTSRFVEQLSPRVLNKSLEPGDEVYIQLKEVSSEGYRLGWKSNVQPYPEDLVDWLKSSRSSRSSSSSRIPTPSCEPCINFNDAEDLKGILIPFKGYPNRIVGFTPGLPVLKYPGRQVVAMCSGEVFINHGKKKEHYTTFGVSMPKIIHDIRRKKPDEAKKWFPNYFD